MALLLLRAFHHADGDDSDFDFGIGLRDTGYVWFMDALGRADPKGDAAAISLVYVAATVIYVGFGGILFIFRRRPEKKGEA